MPIPVPGVPHPDVAVAKAALKEIKPGETVPYENIARAMGMAVKDPAFMRRCATARKHLLRPEEGGISIIAVNGIGFLRETGDQTKAGMEKVTRSIRRRAAAGIKRIKTINVTAMDQVSRSEVWGVAAQLAVIQNVATKRAHARLTAGATAIQAELTNTKALEVLQERNGNGSENGSGSG